MTKKRSIVKLCIVSILTLIGLFLTFFSFVIPTTNTTFKGFFNAINYGYDIDGGVLAVYEPLDKSIAGYELDNKLDVTVSKLNSTLAGWGFSVTKQNSNIRLEISQTSYTELATKLSQFNIDVLSLLNAEEGISFSNSSDDAEAEGFVSGEYIESCTYSYNQQWIVEIKFNEEGKTKFKALTQKIVDSTEASGQKLYMFINGENYNTSGFEMGESAVSSLTLVANNEMAAEALALQVNVLARPLMLSAVITDVVNGGLNTSTGSFFGNQQALLVFVLCAVVVATIALLCVRYRVLGALATLAIAIFTVLYAFLLQSIPLVMMDMNGVMGALLVYLALVGGMVNIFEKIRQEYAVGKKIPNSVTSGFKKQVIPTLERYIFLLVVCVVMFIVGTPALKAIAVNVFVGLFVNYFTLFVVLRGLSNIYLPINSTKKELYNLKRGDIKHEI